MRTQLQHGNGSAAHDRSGIHWFGGSFYCPPVTMHACAVNATIRACMQRYTHHVARIKLAQRLLRFKIHLSRRDNQLNSAIPRTTLPLVCVVNEKVLEFNAQTMQYLPGSSGTVCSNTQGKLHVARELTIFLHRADQLPGQALRLVSEHQVCAPSRTYYVATPEKNEL